VKRMIKIEKSKFGKFIQDLSADYKVFAPAGEGRQSSFLEVSSADQINTAMLKPMNSPKAVFLPQTEILFKFSDEPIQSKEKSDKPLFFWGARSCDARGLNLLNKVMGQSIQKPGDPAFQDPFWKARFDNAIILTLACNEPESTCFCHWTGGHPFSKNDGDLWAVETETVYLIEPISDKGKVFIEGLSGYKSPSKDELSLIQTLQKKAESFLTSGVETEILKDKLPQIWDDPLWDEISVKCVNCSACAFICPTCYCFDIQDEGKKDRGKRIRTWDCCMFPIFTKEASGHNPRSLSRDRVRQRVMHKFSYFSQIYGESLCTGCGRCIHICPVNLDIREVVKQFLKMKLAV
jgi:sulfhydrogenase subunit beta (sulfur reductase)